MLSFLFMCKMERNIKDSTGLCGIAMEASFPVKTVVNPPDPGLSPPSLVTPEVVCDEYNTCPTSTTCCYIYEYYRYCFVRGCFLLEGASCCDGHYSCCPHDYPICNVQRGTCSKSKNSLLETKAIKRILAKRWKSDDSFGYQIVICKYCIDSFLYRITIKIYASCHCLIVGCFVEHEGCYHV